MLLLPMRLRLEGSHARITELAPLFERAAELAGLGSDQLVVFLDSIDHSADATVSEYFHKQAAHFVCLGETHFGVPHPIRPLMSDPTCHFLIWLSKPLLDGDSEQALWVYAHEYRHFMHKKGIGDITRLSRLLRHVHEKEGAVKRFKNLDQADELDCELFAKNVLMKVLGQDRLESFIERRRANPEGAEYYQRLEYLSLEVETSNTAFKSGRSTSAA